MNTKRILLFASLIQLASQTDRQKFLNDLTLQQNAKGQNIRVSAFHYPPFFIITEDNEQIGEINYSGYCFDIIDWIAQTFKLNITFVPVNQSDILKFGITQAIINQLVLKKEVDIVPMVLVPTVKRALLMDFTNPLLIGKNRLMLRYPEEESRLTATARPFSLLLWCIFGLSNAGVIGTMVVVNLYHKRWNQNNNARPVYPFSEIVARNIMLMLSMTTGQDIDFFFPRRLRSFFRLSMGIWCLVMVVVCNAYTGTLTSFLTLPKLKPVVNSLKELAASDRYKLTAEFNTPFTELILKADSGYYKTLGDSLRNNPHLLFRDYNQATENVLHFEAVFMRGSIDVLTRIRDDIDSNNGTCRLTASNPLGDVSFLSFGVKKGYRFTSDINRKLPKLWESGLLNFWFKQYMPNVDKCLITSNRVAKIQKRKLASLNLLDVSSIFLILGFGLSVSLLVFLCELIVSYKK